MERLCFLIHLVPGAEAEYERLHDEIWPRMTEALTEAGFTNYSLFRRDQLVVGYVECVPTVAEANAKYGATEVSAEWNAAFKGIIATMTDEAGELLRADEVWHLP